MAEVVLEKVANILISLAKTELGLAWGVKTELDKLSSALTTIRAVVADAEEKQIKNKNIQKWLIKLKHVAYDAEDVFDDLAIDEPGLLRPDPTDDNFCDSVWISFRSFFMNLKKLIPHYMIAKKIKPIRERFESIVSEMSNFGLIKGVVNGSGAATPPPSIIPSRETGSTSAEPQMYGRDADKENIIKMLLENVNYEHGISVCPILGIGGLGKTTLAQFIYNDDRVQKHFEVKIWICVSDHFNVKRLLKEIVEIVTKRRFDHDNLDVIQDGVLEQLRGKRFLLVLDDVWSHRQDDWNMLKNSLICGAKGSSIIVTTRLKQVASIMKTISEPYQLDGLSEDDCWSLFAFYAFEAGKESVNPNLITIGKEIIKKCGRLPLAAKALGSMLRVKVGERQWREVRDCEIWDLEEEGEILPALKLSYNDLSSRAKQCFAYCCLFRKDYEMSKEELVFLWLANGLLEFKNKEPEDVGEDVLIELKLRSFFQETEEEEWLGEKTVRFKIHDLVHDLASSVMKTEHKHIKAEVAVDEVRNKTNNNIQDDEIRPRHVSSVDVSGIHQFLSSDQRQLRSLFLISNLKLHEDGGMSASNVISVISGLNNLRALRIEGWVGETSLPLSFGDKLKHLRYLILRCNGLSSLQAESFSGMKNLQILDLSGNSSLKTIPDSMGKYMEHLKHLDLSHCDLSSLPAESFSGMKNLQILDLSRNISLKTISDSMGKYMEHLKHLNLSLCDLSSLPAESCSGMKNLQILDLSCNRSLKTLPDSMGKYMEHLKHLNLSHCDLSSLPAESFSGMKNLQILDLSCNRSLKTLPDSMGKYMEHLKHLNLSHCGLSSLPAESFSGMKNLQILDLSWNRSLKTLSDSMGKYMEHLKHLNLSRCGLSSLPAESFSGMKNLQILDLRCNRSLKTLPDSMGKYMEHLKHLNLRHCDLSSLPAESFSGMKNLQILDLSCNISLKTISNSMGKYMEHLKHLNLCLCDLSSLPAESFSGMKNLQILDLSCNGSLKTLPDSMGKYMEHLKHLNLSHCGFSSLPVESFSGMKNLQILDLSWNISLKSIPDSMGKYMEHLKHLNLIC